MACEGGTLSGSPQKFSGLPGGFKPTVRLSRKFHVEGSCAVSQHLQDRWKVDIAGTQRQVFVTAGLHVVDMHVDQTADPRGKQVWRGPLSHALHVADINCELQALGTLHRIDFHAVKQLAIPRQCVDKHTWLWLKTDGHASRRGVAQHWRKAAYQTVPQRIVVGPVAYNTRPERDALS